jgi:hypothetical protein
MRTGLWLAASLLLQASAYAATPDLTRTSGTRVRCSAGETIGGALSRLDKSRPNVLRVSGTCPESVAIEGFADLRIVGSAGATVMSIPGATAYPVSVSASGSVSIEGLTIRVVDDPWKPAIVFWTCEHCRLADITVDGGVGFWAFAWSQVSLARFALTGSGNWGISLANAKLDMEDSVLEGGGPGKRWCGLDVAENAVAVVKRSTFRGFGVGICAASGGQVHLWDNDTVEDNWCGGISASSGSHLAVHQSTVRNNAPNCWSGGVKVDDTARLFIDHTEVSGNTGGGIVVNHQSFARLGVGTVVSNNLGSGLQARNGSMAVAPESPSETVQISGNGVDLACDALSHINNGAQIAGAVLPTPAQCPNLHAGDGPP